MLVRCAQLATATPISTRLIFSVNNTTATIARRACSSSSYCCAVVYISEGRDKELLDSLANAAATTARPDAGLIREFRDPTYNRTGFTIGGRSTSAVVDASLEVSRRALRAIDLRLHEASHPRIGVVDHVSVHPVGPQGAQEASREAGMAIAKGLAEEEMLPVLLYGDLNNGRGLAEVRRSTPYFGSGDIPETIEADLGPNQVNPSKGIVTVGCTPLVTNYNILLSTDSKKLAASVTRRIREKDGGLPWVEALTLKREDGRYEAACNLLRPRETTPAMVLAVAEEQAAVVGIRVIEDYETGLTEEQAMLAISRLDAR